MCSQRTRKRHQTEIATEVQDPMPEKSIGTPLNPHPEKVTIFLRFPEIRPDKTTMFIQVYGGATHANFDQIRDQWTRLRNASAPELGFDDTEGARRLGQRLLEFHVVDRAELFDPVRNTTEHLKAPPPPPYYLCPQCKGKLGGSNECRHCTWMRYPGDREHWGQRGRCPHCEFACRWDGTCCSHCGHGATEEQPRIKIVPES